MSCCELDTETIDENINLLDNNLIATINPQSLLSLNGCRVASKMLQTVTNLDEFR